MGISFNIKDLTSNSHSIIKVYNFIKVLKTLGKNIKK